MNWEYLYDIVKKAARAGFTAGIGVFVTETTGDPKVGLLFASVYGLIGKVLRDKWPAVFGKLPLG